MATVQEARPKQPQAVVFVHGLGGGSRTWGQFGDLVRNDHELSNGFDVLHYSFPTALIAIPFIRKAPRIQTLADGLLTFLHTTCSVYERVHLVCHSLGGLVARHGALRKIKEASDRKPSLDTLTLFAVPCNGAGLASIGKYISPFNIQVRQLCRSSDFLDHLNESWAASAIEANIRVRYIIGGLDDIVSPDSARSYFGNANVETVVDKNHRTIVKPKDSDDLSFIILKQILLTGTRQNGDVPDGLSSLDHQALAEKHYAVGDYAAAEQILLAARDRNQQSSWLARELGKIYFAQRAFGKVNELIESCSKSTKSEDPDLACMKGEYLIRIGEFRGAIEVLTRISPRTVYNLEYLTGNAYFLAGIDNSLNMAFALKHLQAAVKLDAESWWARTNLVYVLQIMRNRGQLPSAIEDGEISQQRVRAWQAISDELTRNPLLFSARLYRLALAAAFDDRVLFEETVSEDINFFAPKKLPVNYIFPSSWLARLGILYEQDDEAFKFYQRGLVSWLASI